ncbi:MAG: nicotinamide mononucleotide transporter [Bacteroidales bacterium]|nr:nicotinamide mononucleotide transporter [Bacteroidales bacterium]
MLESWLLSNWIEIAGAIISLIYLYFSIKQRIWLWPFGVLSALFYILIYFQSKLYADMGLQIYYVFISFYGWIVWSSKSKLGSDMGNLKISHIGRIPGFMASITFIILSGVFYWILVLYTDSDVPFWDALTTSGGVVATWMLTRKYIEHWLIWVFLDIVSIVLYIYKGLYPTTFLFVIYTIMALVGYRTWKNLLNDQRI